MWISACDFAKYIKMPVCNSWKKLIERYKVVHSLAGHINNTLCCMALWWFVGATFFLSLRFNIIFLDISRPENIMINRFILVVHWFLSDMIFAYACGKVCSKVTMCNFKNNKALLCIFTQFLLQIYEVKVWFYKYGKLSEAPIREMNIIADQINNSVIGIHAGGIFTLNYVTISQVCN